MHLLSVVGIGLAANLDNLGIGMSFGSRSTRIPPLSNLIIALLSMIAAYLAIVCGHAVTAFVPDRAANSGGGLLLVAMGLWSLRSERGKRLSEGRSGVARVEEGSLKNEAVRAAEVGTSHVIRHPEAADVDDNQVISWRESFALGGALSLNCVASGLGAGASGLSPIALTLSVGLFSCVTIATGTAVGARLAASWFGQRAGEVGSLILILVGAYEVFV